MGRVRDAKSRAGDEPRLAGVRRAAGRSQVAQLAGPCAPSVPRGSAPVAQWEESNESSFNHIAEESPKVWDRVSANLAPVHEELK